MGWFIAGFFVGGFANMFIMCLLEIAKQSDNNAENRRR